MALSQKVELEIKKLLRNVVMDKLKKYSPETEHMPFHYRLLGRDRYAMFSFIQSMNTTFGISIWEPMAVILARSAGYYATKQYKLMGEIDKDTYDLITRIHNELRMNKRKPNKIEETELIRKNIKRGRPLEDPDSTVDLFIKKESEENYFDITTAKPNKKEFVALKFKLLKWTALRLSQNRDANVVTRLAIPYNPYHPKPYNRWTLGGLYDLENGEILVGEEFWNFVAGDDIYDELLEIFTQVGEELRPIIDKTFSKFRKV